MSLIVKENNFKIKHFYNIVSKPVLTTFSGGSLISDSNQNNRNKTNRTDFTTHIQYAGTDYYNILENGDLVYGVFTSDISMRNYRSASNLFDGSYDSAWNDSYYGDNTYTTTLVYKFTSGPMTISSLLFKEFLQQSPSPDTRIGQIRIFYGNNGFDDSFTESVQTSVSSSLEDVGRVYDVKNQTISILPVNTSLIKIELTGLSNNMPGLSEMELIGIEINGN